MTERKYHLYVQGRSYTFAHEAMSVEECARYAAIKQEAMDLLLLSGASVTGLTYAMLEAKRNHYHALARFGPDYQLTSDEEQQR